MGDVEHSENEFYYLDGLEFNENFEEKEKTSIPDFQWADKDSPRASQRQRVLHEE